MILVIISAFFKLPIRPKLDPYIVPLGLTRHSLRPLQGPPSLALRSHAPDGPWHGLLRLGLSCDGSLTMRSPQAT